MKKVFLSLLTVGLVGGQVAAKNQCILSSAYIGAGAGGGFGSVSNDETKDPFVLGAGREAVTGSADAADDRQGFVSALSYAGKMAFNGFYGNITLGGQFVTEDSDTPFTIGIEGNGSFGKFTGFMSNDFFHQVEADTSGWDLSAKSKVEFNFSQYYDAVAKVGFARGNVNPYALVGYGWLRGKATPSAQFATEAGADAFVPSVNGKLDSKEVDVNVNGVVGGLGVTYALDQNFQVDFVGKVLMTSKDTEILKGQEFDVTYEMPNLAGDAMGDATEGKAATDALKGQIIHSMVGCNVRYAVTGA